MNAYELVVVQPIKGTKGKIMYTLTRYAESVSAAVKLTRQDIEGSGWIVMQRSAYAIDPAPQAQKGAYNA